MELRTLMDGIAFGESPRWHDGRLWFCDWAAEQLIALGLDGSHELIAHVPSFPFSIDWLPDGRLVVVAARQQALLTLADDGSLERHTDLTVLSERPPGNEIVIDVRGRIYVNGGGFDLSAGEAFAPGMIALIAPYEPPRVVAEGLEFPNGMAITPDGATLIVAESYGRRLTAFEIGADGSLANRRVWADLGDGVPDGICVDTEGAVWYADVPNRRCSRVREGGQELDRVELDRGCFACMLGGPTGADLFIVAREWHGAGDLSRGNGTGQVVVTGAPAPHAGRP